jgi:hypothetical protein
MNSERFLRRTAWLSMPSNGCAYGAESVRGACAVADLVLAFGCTAVLSTAR